MIMLESERLQILLGLIKAIGYVFKTMTVRAYGDKL